MKIIRPLLLGAMTFALGLGLLAGCGSGSGDDPAPGPAPGPVVGSPVTTDCAPLPAASSDGFDAKLQAFMNAFCYRDWQHDAAVRTSNGVHPWVKVYYSPSMFQWMSAGDRQADVPGGAMLVKEQYQSSTAPLTEWTVMVKDPAGAYDGWYWADLAAPGAAPAPLGKAKGFAGCAEASYPAIGFGQYCINCHASAAAGQSTFATTNFLSAAGGGGTSPDTSGNAHRLLVHRPFSLASLGAGCMIPESFDHVVPSGKPNGPLGFVTSDQCAGCHDATGTLSPTRADLPSMLWPDALAPSMTNLSPNGEWRFSMMGLAGRDPIFFSQLNSETSLHPKIEGQSDAKAFVEDTCLRCHGVMGQRQFHLDNPGQLFTRDHLADPASKYGALAREGVSCVACHRISNEGLGTPATYTGLFNLDPPNQINGPYSDPKVASMKNALGMTPQSTPANQIQSSKLCGSCHQIFLPVYDAQGKAVVKNGQPFLFPEQSTFFEWQNSNFADNGITPKSCQDCHMPRVFNGNPLSFKIANIEDSSFPAVDFRLPDSDIAMRPRAPYARHQLLGINVFGLEMFKQFRTDLGLYQTNPMLRNPERTVPGIDQAIGEAVAIASGTTTAASQTASIKVFALEVLGKLTVNVKVTNLAGHNLPSGVGFRRAFVHLEALDASDKVLWQSGNTNADGVIVDGSGNPLVTEFFTPTQQQFQPHYWSGNPVKREDQVQIFEELVVNPQGLLTTSFLALDHKVKENRIQPRGYSPTGPNADELAPVGVCTADGRSCDPRYGDGTGSSDVSYVITDPKVANAARVRATLYYQAIPPYYLQQRATDATGTDTDRLKFYSKNLQVRGTAIENWKLRIVSTVQGVL